MQKLYDQIWGAALPYQDKRGDTGHAEVTYGFARELVTRIGGEPQVIFPAIILHDIGWSQLSRQERFVIFDANASASDVLAVRLLHQTRGVVLAQEILQSLAYPAEWIPEILEIISQHDTRKYFLSHNEGVVRDADKLWRFSAIGFEADVLRFGVTPTYLEAKLIRRSATPGFFYSPTSQELALAELALRMEHYAKSLCAEAVL